MGSSVQQLPMRLRDSSKMKECRSPDGSIATRSMNSGLCPDNAMGLLRWKGSGARSAVNESIAGSRCSEAGGKSGRILEKQNQLQMSQVFPFPCIEDQTGLAFQGFYKRGPFTPPTPLSTDHVTPTPRRSEARPRWGRSPELMLRRKCKDSFGFA